MGVTTYTMLRDSVIHIGIVGRDMVILTQLKIKLTLLVKEDKILMGMYY